MNASFLFSLRCGARPLNNSNSLGARQHRDAGKPDEQSMLDDARNEAQQLRQMRRVRDALEMRIDDPVAAIGDKNVTVAAFSQAQLAGNAARRKRLFDRALGRTKAERNDLDRQRKTAERLDPF